MQPLRNLLITLALSGFFSVPPCDGAGVITFTNDVLQVRSTVEVSFTARSNVVYNLYVAPTTGSEWGLHPSCSNRTFEEGYEYKYWDNPEHQERYFKLEMTESGTTNFTTVTPQPSPVVTTAEAGVLNSLPPIPGAITEETDEK